MIFSMTGYGSGEYRLNNSLYKIELRSLNSKSLDINFKAPNSLKPLENQLRNQLNELIRGKVDVQINEENNNETEETKASVLNIPLMHQYHEQLKKFTEAAKIDGADLLRSILTLPNVIKDTNEANDMEAISLELSTALKNAILQLKEFQIKEGLSLEKDIVENLENISLSLKQITEHEPNRITRIKEKFDKEIQQLKNEYDVNSGRLEMEMIFYIEKLDINEEKVRLASHIEYFKEILADNSTIEKGKKLGFLSQEIGREINTIGSKANHAEIQKSVILMKNELEKIKEQINNVL
jgi:uncharacterized protein (TIGR00255 family)